MRTKKSSTKKTKKGSSKKKTSSKKTSQGKWPTEREVLFTPWRLPYIKGQTTAHTSDACVFCDAIDRGPSFESLILDVSEHSAIILNKFPYNNGHTMVIPRKHISDLADLSHDEFSELHLQLKRAYRLLCATYEPHGVNLGMNIGKVSGAGIAGHIHYHLLPRWGGDTNFMPLIAGTKVISEALETTYERLKKNLKYFSL